MTLGGFPIYVFVPVVVSAALALFVVQQLSVLTRSLGIDPKDSADGKRLSAALYGGEGRLHELGVRRTVWAIRLAFIGQTAGILLFTYLIYRVTGAV